MKGNPTPLLAIMITLVIIGALAIIGIIAVELWNTIPDWIWRYIF